MNTHAISIILSFLGGIAFSSAVHPRNRQNEIQRLLMRKLTTAQVLLGIFTLGYNTLYLKQQGLSAGIAVALSLIACGLGAEFRGLFLKPSLPHLLGAVYQSVTLGTDLYVVRTKQAKQHLSADQLEALNILGLDLQKAGSDDTHFTVRLLDRQAALLRGRHWIISVESFSPR